MSVFNFTPQTLVRVEIGEIGLNPLAVHTTKTLALFLHPATFFGVHSPGRNIS